MVSLRCLFSEYQPSFSRHRAACVVVVVVVVVCVSTHESIGTKCNKTGAPQTGPSCNWYFY